MTISEAPAKRTRTPRARLAAVPNALSFPPEPAPANIGGEGTVGYLRALVNSIPKSYSDAATVSFSDDATTVTPAR